jgi:Leucine-rich repeat (LRR) protein
LRLDDNQLEDINGLLMSQHHLQWLNVSHNQLQWFDYAFIPKSVLWLSLRSNQIEELANYYEMRTGMTVLRFAKLYYKIFIFY